ncbi:PREDICTED: carcinoembryonic antigen-related cell adhesion molecule 2-like [Cyprinodon variegatus]|uniref:carcinoembryonic antigen-related cell adhesion molecule 2-like n=1 Tax=Cyprinodon variegatus TaxID=28743 RepID=UPI0007425D68|nr:PREDICTED: carcinoembryonic antigen-related cell adhesion molecule 2-like [Cyprinodon variegatus]
MPRIPDNYYVQWFFETESEPGIADNNYLGRNSVSNSDIWKGKLSANKGKLTISNIEQENIGTFICKVKNALNYQETRTFKLIKVDVSMKGDSPVTPGDTLSLSCKVEGQTQTQTYWIKPSGIETKTGEFNEKAESQHNGEWTCVVKEVRSFKFSVSVVDIFFSVLDFSFESKHLYTSTNLPLTVSILITPNKFLKQILSKIKEIQWVFIPKKDGNKTVLLTLKNGPWAQKGPQKGLIFKNFTKEGNVSLYRNPAKEEDRGSYNCSITFTNGIVLTRTVFVEVLKIIPSPGKKLISGNHLNLSCSTGGTLDADIKVQWFPPKTSSQGKAKLSSDPLYTIPRVGTTDSGEWRCELQKNATTLTSAVIILEIDPILTAWMVVTICGAAVILILLLIVSVTLFRRRQRKIRNFRHRLCKCENPKPKGFFKA